MQADHGGKAISIPSPNAANACQAVAWRSEHQLWASDRNALKLWDLRAVAHPLATYQLDQTPVHSLCPCNEGVIAGTLSGSYAMSFQPDGRVQQLACLGMPGETAGSCVSVALAPAAQAQNGSTASDAVVTSFRRSSQLEGDVEHHSLGCLSQGAFEHAPRQWLRNSARITGFASTMTATRCAALWVGGTPVLCGGDESTGAIRAWRLRGGGLGAAESIGELRDGIHQHHGSAARGLSAAAHVRHVAVAPSAEGAWTVAALRTKASSTAEPVISLYHVPAADASRAVQV